MHPTNSSAAMEGSRNKVRRAEERTIWYMSDFSGLDLPASAMRRVKPDMVHLFSSEVDSPGFQMLHPNCRNSTCGRVVHWKLRCELPPPRFGFKCYVADLTGCVVTAVPRDVLFEALSQLEPDIFVLRMSVDRQDEVYAMILTHGFDEGYDLETWAHGQDRTMAFVAGIQKTERLTNVQWPSDRSSSGRLPTSDEDVWEEVFRVL